MFLCQNVTAAVAAQICSCLAFITHHPRLSPATQAAGFNLKQAGETDRFWHFWNEYL